MRWRLSQRDLERADDGALLSRVFQPFASQERARGLLIDLERNVPISESGSGGTISTSGYCGGCGGRGAPPLRRAVPRAAQEEPGAAAGEAGMAQDACFTTTDDGGNGGTAWTTANSALLIGVFNGAFFIDSTKG